MSNNNNTSNNSNNNKTTKNNNKHKHVRVFDGRRAAMSKRKNSACCDGNQAMGGAGDKLIEASVMYGGVSDVEAQVMKLWRRLGSLPWALPPGQQQFPTEPFGPHKGQTSPHVKGGLFIFFAAGFIFFLGSCSPASLLSCFSAFLRLCFSASLLFAFPASLLFCFPAFLLLVFLASLPFCFSAFLLPCFPTSLLFCFLLLCSLFSLLICFSDSLFPLLLCFSAWCFCAFLLLLFHSFFSHVVLLLYFLPLCFFAYCLYCLFVFHFVLLYSPRFVSRMKSQRDPGWNPRTP